MVCHVNPASLYFYYEWDLNGFKAKWLKNYWAAGHSVSDNLNGRAAGGRLYLGGQVKMRVTRAYIMKAVFISSFL